MVDNNLQLIFGSEAGGKIQYWQERVQDSVRLPPPFPLLDRPDTSGSLVLVLVRYEYSYTYSIFLLACGAPRGISLPRRVKIDAA
jgi:hypothetical protein